MTPISEQRLEAELRSMRPLPRSEFAAELDAGAAAGFQRGPGSPRTWTAGLIQRLRSTPPRRILAPAAAVALVAIAVSTAVIATREGGDSEVDRGFAEAPAKTSLQRVPLPTTSPGGSGSGSHAESGAGGDTSGMQYEDALPAAGTAAASSGVESGVESGTSPPGRYAAGAAHRDVERAAQIVLAATPSDVREDAAQVFEAVHAADGIVLSSSVRDGRAGQAGARFELLIPSARLSDAMASFSSIATVHTRHESSEDITAPTVSAAERLQDANATIRGLLGQLSAAETDSARVAAEAELRVARAKAAAIRSGLSTLERRDNLSRVSLRIETRDAPSGSDGGGGAWGVGDGLHGAGRVLAIAVGVTAIAAAALAPLALIVLLAWLGHSSWIRRARRHALE